MKAPDVLGLAGETRPRVPRAVAEFQHGVGEVPASVLAHPSDTQRDEVESVFVVVETPDQAYSHSLVLRVQT